jgi:hypothetical protein
MARDYSIASDPRQIFLQSVALQRAEQDRRVKLERQQSLQTDLAALMEKPDTQSFANFYLKYPEAKEQVEGYRKTMGEGDKNAILEASQTAFILNRENRPEDVVKLFDERIEALKNSNRPDLAQTFERAKATYNTTTDPKAREAVLSTIIYNYGGGEAHEKIFGSNVQMDTPFIKELYAEGKKPGTAEWEEALRAKREGDPWVAVPNVGLFLKRDLQAAIANGQPSVTPQIPQNAVNLLKQNPSLAADFDKKYGTPSNPNPSSRIIGGQTGAPSGNFRKREEGDK